MATDDKMEICDERTRCIMKMLYVHFPAAYEIHAIMSAYKSLAKMSADEALDIISHLIQVGYAQHYSSFETATHIAVETPPSNVEYACIPNRPDQITLTRKGHGIVSKYASGPLPKYNKLIFTNTSQKEYRITSSSNSCLQHVKNDNTHCTFDGITTDSNSRLFTTHCMTSERGIDYKNHALRMASLVYSKCLLTRQEARYTNKTIMLSILTKTISPADVSDGTAISIFSSTVHTSAFNSAGLFDELIRELIADGLACSSGSGAGKYFRTTRKGDIEVENRLNNLFADESWRNLSVNSVLTKQTSHVYSYDARYLEYLVCEETDIEKNFSEKENDIFSRLKGGDLLEDGVHENSYSEVTYIPHFSERLFDAPRPAYRALKITTYAPQQSHATQ